MYSTKKGKIKSFSIRTIIKSSSEANSALNKFISQFPGDARYISLGQNCSTAWYLKELGLKDASYPFDWVFSSAEIILDCIDDDFNKFLNKSLIVPKKGNQSAGHRYYHANMFNHRNPLRSEEDYHYYMRCCDRFKNIIKSSDHIVYLVTLINEPQKRTLWSKGFNENFKTPLDQSSKTIQNLIENLKMGNINCRFIIIDHYTEEERKISYQEKSENLFELSFHAGGDSTGVRYTDPLDDFCYKYMLSGLIK